MKQCDCYCGAVNGACLCHKPEQTEVFNGNNKAVYLVNDDYLRKHHPELIPPVKNINGDNSIPGNTLLIV